MKETLQELIEEIEDLKKPITAKYDASDELYNEALTQAQTVVQKKIESI